MTTYRHPHQALSPGLALAGWLVALSIVLVLGYLVHDQRPPGVIPVNAVSTESIVSQPDTHMAVVQGAPLLADSAIRARFPSRRLVDGDPTTSVPLAGGHDPELVPATGSTTR